MSLVRNSRGESADAPALIARNLEAVLNSRPGHGSVVEVFGLGDPTSWDRHAGQLRGLAVAILALVRQFEPRLREPALRSVTRESSLWARFEIEGHVQGATQRFVIRYHAILRNVLVEPVRTGT